MTQQDQTKPADRQHAGPADHQAGGGPARPPGNARDRSSDVPSNPGLGSRAALPEGSLPGPYLDAQGDENRQPPANAPVPPQPAVTIEPVRRGAAAEPSGSGRDPSPPGKPASH